MPCVDCKLDRGHCDKCGRCIRCTDELPYHQIPACCKRRALEWAREWRDRWRTIANAKLPELTDAELAAMMHESANIIGQINEDDTQAWG